jgi:protease-4
MLNGAREMSEEERQYVEGLVMQSYGRFVGIVAKARKLDETKLREGVADGRILSGTDAHAAGLIDQLGYVEDAYTKAMELAGVTDAKVVQYKRQVTFGDLFSIFGEARTPEIKIDLLAEAPRLLPGRVYLMPAIFAP